MFKKLAVTGAVLAAACGASLMAAPAHADTWVSNSSVNRGSAQSGNVFGNVAATNIGSGSSTNSNTINGISVTARNSVAGLAYRFGR
ncbi:hypothetical protein [Herbidospora mongoliensis]|uniref:hypothetical protein n=1 Tax=Herbidospora mongoliensis TaxID=688067 RepID=UPI000831C8AD|nr:hypothetical protein [Herbidospora mongoliensis]